MCPTALGRKEKKLSNVHIVHCQDLTIQMTQMLEHVQVQ